MNAIRLIGESPAWLPSALAQHEVAIEERAASVAIWVAGECPADWTETRAALESAFSASREAFSIKGNALFVLNEEDLFGLRGAPSAMLACGLLSAARAAAVEGARNDLRGVAFAVDEETEPTVLAAALATALAPGAGSGALVPLGRTHLGRAMP